MKKRELNKKLDECSDKLVCSGMAFPSVNVWLPKCYVNKMWENSLRQKGFHEKEIPTRRKAINMFKNVRVLIHQQVFMYKCLEVSVCFINETGVIASVSLYLVNCFLMEHSIAVKALSVLKCQLSRNKSLIVKEIFSSRKYCELKNRFMLAELDVRVFIQRLEFQCSLCFEKMSREGRTSQSLDNIMVWSLFPRSEPFSFRVF